MKVILLEEVRGKGGEGDVVEVARGFANNYLLKNKLAVKATKGNLKQLEQRRAKIAQREEVRINSAETRKGQLEAMTVVIPMRVGEEGQLFGSVTAQMIADAIAEQNEGGVEVDRRRIDARQPIKAIGEHQVDISLYREIKATITVKVVDEANPDGEPVEDEAAEVIEGEGAGAVEAATEEAVDADAEAAAVAEEVVEEAAGAEAEGSVESTED